LSEVGIDGGFDWRRNPSWVVLLVLLVAVTAVVAVPVAVAVAPLVALAVGASIGPILVVGVIIGFDLRTVRIVGIFLILGVLIGSIVSLLGPQPAPAPGDSPGGTVAPVAPPATTDLIAWIGLGVVLIVIAIVILARLWMRRLTPPDSPIREERTIDRSVEPTAKRKGRRGRPGQPTTAVAAYVRLVEDLAGRPTFRREPAETPSEHARRLRRAGQAGLALDLLAADYALARFAEHELTPLEDRRAVDRWRELRRRLIERPDAT
jgi:Domain of unknown function (DUF4129)